MTIPIPIPTGLPLDLCYPISLGRQMCVQTGGIVDNLGQPRDCVECPGGETPPLVSVDVTYAEKTITLNPLEESEVIWEQSVWMGVETDLGAAWVGEPISQQCASYELPDVDPTAAVHSIADTVWGTAEDIVEDQFGYQSGSSIGIVATAMVAVLIALLVVSPAPP